MWNRFQGFVDQMGAAFWQGRLDEVAACYDAPLPVYLQGQILAYRNRGALLQALQSLRAGLVAHGVTSMAGITDALTLPGEKGQVRAGVHWVYQRRGDLPEMNSEVAYYCRPDGDRFLIEMAEYRKPLPCEVYSGMAPKEGASPCAAPFQGLRVVGERGG